MSDRPSEGGESGASLGRPSRHISDVSSLSLERHQMKETLQHMKVSLAQMSPPPPLSTRSGLAPVPAPTKLPGSVGTVGAQPALEGLLEDIASRLSSIEGMYTDMSSRLVRNEGTIRDLQHISAGAISETARLVDIVRTGGTPMTGSRGALTAVPGNVTPPPMRSAVRTLDHLPGTQTTSTLQQHASQIHKLIAGLDFLEQHIIRQDQVIEGVQKQLVMVARDQSAGGMHSPSELAMQIHDISELVNKLRSHMYKVEKKASGSETSVQLVNSRVSQLAARLEALEHASMNGQGTINNPLFSSPEDGSSRSMPAGAAQLAVLAEAQAELRSTVKGMGRDLQGLMQQVQQLSEVQAAAVQAGSSSSPSELQELKQQVAYLMANHSASRAEASRSVAEADERLAQLQQQQREAAAAAERVQNELMTVRRQLAAVVDSVEERLEAAQNASRAGSRSLSLNPGAPMSPVQAPPVSPADSAALTDPAYTAALEQLQQGMELLAERVSNASDDMGARVAAAEAAARAAADAAAAANEHASTAAHAEAVAALERQLASVQARVEDNAAVISMLSANSRAAGESEATSAELRTLQQAVEELATRTAAHMSATAAVDHTVLDSISRDVEQLKAVASQLAGEVGEVRASTMQQQARSRSLGEEDPEVRASELASALSAVRADQVLFAAKVQEQLDQSVVAQVAARASLAAAVGQMEEEQDSLREAVATLQSSMPSVDGIKAELKERLDTVMGTIRERVDETSTTLGARVSELSDANEELKRMVTAALEEVGGEVVRLTQAGEEMKPTLDMVSLLKNEVADLYVAQQTSRSEMLTVSDQVVELAGKLDTECVQRSELQGMLAEAHEAAVLSAESVAVDVATLRGMVEDSSASSDQLKQAVAKLIVDLDAVNGTTAEVQARLGDLATQLQVKGLAEVVEELQTCQQDVAVGLKDLKVAVERDYINHEKLGAIFAAREDMKAALSKLEHVFSSGHLSKQASVEVKQQLEAVEDTLARAGIATPRMSAAIDDMNAKIAELQSQINLLTYRTEGAVRQEQLASMQQAMVTLEMQLKGYRKPSVTAEDVAAAPRSLPAGEDAPAADSTADEAAAEPQLERVLTASASRRGGPITNIDEAATHIARLEGHVRELREFAADTEVVVEVDVPALKTAVAEMQLIIFELRQAQVQQTAAAAEPAEAGDEPAEPAAASEQARGLQLPDADSSSEDEAYPGFVGAGKARMSRTGSLPRASRTGDLQHVDEEDEFGSFAGASASASPAPPAVAASPATRAVAASSPADAASAVALAELKRRVEGLEGSLVSKVQALEARVMFSAAPLPGAVQQAQAAELLADMPAHIQASMTLRNEMDELQAAFNTMRGQLDSVRLSMGMATPKRGNSGDGSNLALGVAAAMTTRSVLDNLALQSSTTSSLELELGSLRSQVQQLASDVSMLHGSQEGVALTATRASETSYSLSTQVSELQGRVEVMASVQQQQSAALAAVAASAARSAAPASSLTLPLHVAGEGGDLTQPQRVNLDDDSTPRAASSTANGIASEAFAAALDHVSTRLSALEQSVAAQGSTLGDLQQEVASVRTLGGTTTLSRSRPDDSILAAASPVRAPAASSGAPPRPGSTASLSGLDMFPGSPGMGGSRAPGGSGFIQRLLEVVRRQSSRMRNQYADEAGLEGQLQEVDRSLEEVEARLGAGASPAETQAAYAEAMVTILEQVATLRTIGSQTHPAIHQMLLSHDSTLQDLKQKVQDMVSNAATNAASSAVAAAEEIQGRLTRLEAGYRKLSDNQAALNKMVDVFTTSSLEAESNAAAVGGPVEGVGGVPAGGEGSTPALRAVAAKVAQLEELVSTLAPKVSVGDNLQRTPSEAVSREGSPSRAGSSRGADAIALAALEGKLGEYGKVLQAMRNRIVALQEYVDSTQGMVKELHTVHGSVLMRLGALESTTSSGSGGGGDNGQLQSELDQLAAKMAAFEVKSSEVSNALDGLRRVGDRLAALDARDGEMASKLAAIGQTMPVIAGQLKGLERKLHEKLDACCAQLESLGSALSEISRMEKPDSKNPFAGLGAQNNPTIKLLESKVELLRTALTNVARALAADFKADRAARGASSDGL
mmetsp:Transcript_26082/g.66351  ORF Transcript_26082/g.66351 Transcript_26082/m.66351 type:complete len:2106 (+) Transcript_26082:205-6522(+)|eukprot:CAMPEP_0202857598 /NCGR_PEP_ID=MMETSP1391-20130828/477_1 /ASSEMBLY_ACC=CAM_ASM_000867 /TAXON_ID=1034604 /ORGANISM="Chlamydomonas leiostraca, Strain SAG 11-49" /LENGTH=2105 /DNA_ID=CAMNT_0049536417 /DNA_START=279 /DNA_END=6596 /DNA_ORIENTATION=-